MAEIRGVEAFEKCKRLIVIAAHPDDLETMCGGTIKLLAEQGVEIYSVNCTLGDIGAQDNKLSRPMLATIRLAETETAAEILGVKQTFNLRRPDGELVSDLALRGQIARLYRITQADTLFTFDPYWTGQIHPDHRAAGQVAIDAYIPSKMPLYRPEQLNEPGSGRGCIERIFLFSTDRDPDVYIDITDIYDIKLTSSKAHVSQFLDGEKDLEWMKERDRRQGEVIGVRYAERFKQVEVW